MKRAAKKLQLLVFSVLLAFLLSVNSFAQGEPLNSESYLSNRIFTANDTLCSIREKITRHGFGFTVEHNWVFDMSSAEKERFFSRRPLDLPGKRMQKSDNIGPLADPLAKKSLPQSFDLRSYNGHSYIGSVRNQGSCGGCYAFGAAASAEGTYNLANGLYDNRAVDFSESFIVWCLGAHGPYSAHFGGCDGADYTYSELEALTKEGILWEHDFPYVETDPGSCTHWQDPAIVFTSWHRVPCGDIDAIKAAIMNYGVIDVAVYATSAFQAYNSGIYEDANTECDGNPCSYTTTNHAVALVGWNDNGDAENDGYWILRNSWGSSWGEDGYMRIKYHSAAVACAATYLVYEEGECVPTSLSVNASSPQAGFSISAATSTLVKVEVRDNCNSPVGRAQVTASFSNNDTALRLYDDGNHNDGERSDGVYANDWLPVNEQSQVVVTIDATKTDYTSGSTTVSGSIGDSACVILSEGFEDNLMPPENWTQGQSNDETWESVSAGEHTDVYAGLYGANIFYDEDLSPQDEIFISPALPANITSASVEFWSQGSVAWGVTPHDNYDLEVWLVVGNWDHGSGDDLLLATADDDWTGDFEWSKTEVDFSAFLPSYQGRQLRIGFRYHGTDGAQASVDAIRIEYCSDGDTCTHSPGIATPDFPAGEVMETSPSYTWDAVDCATWYNLWVGDPAGSTAVHAQWYLASSICADGVCTVTPDLILEKDDYAWWVQTWNNYGYGDWSPGLAFSVIDTAYTAEVLQLWPVENAYCLGRATLWAEVQNTVVTQSSLPFPRGASVWFYVAGPGWSGTWAGSDSVVGLAAGDEDWYSMEWRIPAGADGQFVYWAQVWLENESISEWSPAQIFTVNCGDNPHSLRNFSKTIPVPETIKGPPGSGVFNHPAPVY